MKLSSTQLSQVQMIPRLCDVNAGKRSCNRPTSEQITAHLPTGGLVLQDPQGDSGKTPLVIGKGLGRMGELRLGNQ